jgi:hypothetical protein
LSKEKELGVGLVETNDYYLCKKSKNVRDIVMEVNMYKFVAKNSGIVEWSKKKHRGIKNTGTY